MTNEEWHTACGTVDRANRLRQRAVKRERNRFAQLRIVERWRAAIGDQAAAGVPTVDPAFDLGCRALDFLQ